jgi:carbamoylphosphate synthase large subunit
MVFISPEKGAHIAASKLRTAEALASMGVAVPRTLDGNEPRERAADEVGFPMLAKPDFSRGGRGVVVINTPEELAAETREGIIFQEFIPGEEYDGNLFIEDGRAAAAVVLRKTLLKEGIVGNAAGVERVEHPEVLDLCVTSALKLDLTGPLDIDVRLREDGTPVVLEINARLGGNVLSAPEVLESLYSAWIIKEEN